MAEILRGESDAMKSTVSIALCTFNGERFLREQLASYAAQSQLPDEVVVCDDGSTDSTLEILEEWAKTVPFPVRIFRNEQNLGYAQNFGKAVSLCTGDIIFLSDQDDVWLPEKIEKMVQVFEKDTEVVLAVSDAFIMDAQGERQTGRLRELTQLWYFDEPAAFCTLDPRPEDCYPQGCAAAFRASIRKLFLPIPSLWTHDIWLQVTAQLAGKGKVVQEPLFSYRLYSGNTSAFGLFEERKRIWEHKKKIHYWNIPQQYWAWLPMIGQFEERLSRLPNERQKPIRKRLRQNARHFTNRNRIQRNALAFGILALWEIFTGGYFRRPFPFRSLFHDLKLGLRNAADPRKYREEWKLWRGRCQKNQK